MGDPRADRFAVLAGWVVAFLCACPARNVAPDSGRDPAASDPPPISRAVDGVAGRLDVVIQTGHSEGIGESTLPEGMGFVDASADAAPRAQARRPAGPGYSRWPRRLLQRDSANGMQVLTGIGDGVRIWRITTGTWRGSRQPGAPERRERRDLTGRNPRRRRLRGWHGGSVARRDSGSDARRAWGTLQHGGGGRVQPQWQAARRRNGPRDPPTLGRRRAPAPLLACHVGIRLRARLRPDGLAIAAASAHSGDPERRGDGNVRSSISKGICSRGSTPTLLSLRYASESGELVLGVLRQPDSGLG